MGPFLMLEKQLEQWETFQAHNYIIKKKGRRKVRIQPDFAKRLKMDYENFKESFIEDVKAGLYERGIDANVSIHEAFIC